MVLRIHSCCYVRYLQQKLSRNTRQVSGKYFIIYWIKYFKIGLKIGLKILWDDIFIIMFYLEVSHIEILEIKCPYSELFWSVFSPHFPAFKVNTDRYGVSLRIQSECGKMWNRKNLRIWTLFTQWCTKRLINIFQIIYKDSSVFFTKVTVQKKDVLQFQLQDYMYKEDSMYP